MFAASAFRTVLLACFFASGLLPRAKAQYAVKYEGNGAGIACCRSEIDRGEKAVAVRAIISFIHQIRNEIRENVFSRCSRFMVSRSLRGSETTCVL